MATNILYKKLSNAREEKDVDNAYAEAFMKAYKINVIEHPFKCDGYIEDFFKKLIIEYKYDEAAEVWRRTWRSPNWKSCEGRSRRDDISDDTRGSRLRTPCSILT